MPKVSQLRQGGSLRHHIERRANELALGPFTAFGDDDVDELIRVLRQVATPMVATGEIHFPNPMGLPRPD